MTSDYENMVASKPEIAIKIAESEKKIEKLQSKLGQIEDACLELISEKKKIAKITRILKK